jgi:hypothetical protein
VLIYGLGGCHCDTLIFLGLMGGGWLLASGKPGPSGAAAALTLAVKVPTALLALPTLIHGRGRRAFVAFAGVGVLTVLLSLLLFAGHLPATGQLGVVQGNALPSEAFRLLGLAFTPRADLALEWLAVLGCLTLCGLTAMGSVGPQVATAASAMLLISASPLSDPWYCLWFMGSAALSSSRPLKILAVSLSAYCCWVALPPFR